MRTSPSGPSGRKVRKLYAVVGDIPANTTYVSSNLTDFNNGGFEVGDSVIVTDNGPLSPLFFKANIQAATPTGEVFINIQFVNTSAAPYAPPTANVDLTIEVLKG